MIQLRDISKKYGSQSVLEGLSWSIAKGEFHVLMGENGKGKTTLARIMAGLEQADAGEVNSADELRVMLVQQDFVIWPSLTVKNNLSIAGSSKEWQPWAEKLDVIPLLKKKAGDLSYGQRQRVSLARALTVSPDLLIVDEGVSHLDRKQRERVIQEIEREREERGMSVIWITHDDRDATELNASSWILTERGLVRAEDMADEER